MIHKAVAFVTALVICLLSGCGLNATIPLTTTAEPPATEQTTVPTTQSDTSTAATTEPTVTTEDPHIAAAEEGRAMLKNAARRLLASGDSLNSFLEAMKSGDGFYSMLDAEGKLNIPGAPKEWVSLLKSFGVYLSSDIQGSNFLTQGQLFFSGNRILNSVITGDGESVYINLSPLYAYIIQMTSDDYGQTVSGDESEAINEILGLMQAGIYTDAVEWLLDVIDCAVDNIDQSAFEKYRNELTVTITPENAAKMFNAVGEFMLSDTSFIDQLEKTLTAAEDYVTLITPQAPPTTETTVPETTETTTTEPPMTETTTTEPSTTEATTTEPSTTEATTTEPPVTEATTTEPPATEATTTEPPVTEAATTEPPTTETTTTEPPVTEATTTEPPVTDTTASPAETLETSSEPPAEETTTGDPLMLTSYSLSAPAAQQETEMTVGEKYRATADLFISASADMFEDSITLTAMGSKLSLLAFAVEIGFNGDRIAVDYFNGVSDYSELSMVYERDGEVVAAVYQYADLLGEGRNCTLEAFFGDLAISAVYTDNEDDDLRKYSGAATVTYEGETSLSLPITFELEVSSEEIDLSASVESEELAYREEDILASGSLDFDIVLRKGSDAEIVIPTERVVSFKDFASRGNYAIAMIRAMMGNKYLKILADTIWGR